MWTPRWVGSRSTEHEISAETSFSCGPRRRRIALPDARARRRARGRCGPRAPTTGGQLRAGRPALHLCSQTYQGDCDRRNDLPEARQPGVPRPADAARDRLRLRADDHAGGGGSSRTFVGYAEMIETASQQLAELIDELSLAARIETIATTRSCESVAAWRSSPRPRPSRSAPSGSTVSGDGRRRSTVDADAEALGRRARPVRAPPRRPRRGHVASKARSCASRRSRRRRPRSSSARTCATSAPRSR